MLETLILGDTLNFTTNVAAYPASSGWTLKLRLLPRVSGSNIDLTSAPDTTDPTLHRFQASATITAAWAAGSYSWASWVEKAAEKYSVDTGVMTLKADPRNSSAPFDGRSPARVALDAAKAALYAWSASSTTVRYKIGEREMQFNTKAEIVGLISRLEVEVNREVNADRRSKGLASKNRVFVRCANA